MRAGLTLSTAVFLLALPELAVAGKSPSDEAETVCELTGLLLCNDDSRKWRLPALLGRGSVHSRNVLIYAIFYGLSFASVFLCRS